MRAAMRKSGPTSHPKHLCLAARPLATIEHLQVLARQAEREGFEVCWLDLGDRADLAEFVREHGSPTAEPVDVPNARSLTRHFRKHRTAGVWIQSPYAEHYPSWFWPRAEAYGLCFAGYALTLTTWDHGHYGLDTYQRCEWILTENDDERGRFERHGVGPHHLLLAGNPLLHELRSRLPYAEPPSIDLLWAPHWIDDWFGEPGFARWRETAPTLLAYARDNPNRTIVVRPHPFLPAIIDAAADTPGAVAYRQLLELSNVSLTSRPMIEDVLRSQALLTDSLSIIVYFSATGRPLGVVRDAQSPALNEAGSTIMDVVDTLGSQTAVTNWLRSSVLAAPDPERARTVGDLYPDLGKSPLAVWALAVKGRSGLPS